MVDRSNDHLYTWTLEHDAMKAAGCCLTLFDPAKGAPEMEFEMTRSEIEPMDVTVTRDRGLGQSDEQVRFEGGRILTLREAESTRTWRQEQDIRSLPAPPGSLGGFAFAWAGEVRLTNEDVNMWRGHYRVDADCPWPDHRACLQCPRCAQPAAPGGDATYIMVWQTLAQITETGPKIRMMPRLFCRPCIERIVQLADPRYTPPAPVQLAVAERPELPSMVDRISMLASLRASGGITEAEFARAKTLAEERETLAQELEKVKQRANVTRALEQKHTRELEEQKEAEGPASPENADDVVPQFYHTGIFFRRIILRRFSKQVGWRAGRASYLSLLQMRALRFESFFCYSAMFCA